MRVQLIFIKSKIKLNSEAVEIAIVKGFWEKTHKKSKML